MPGATEDTTESSSAGAEVIAFNRARIDEDERELQKDPPVGLGYANLAARFVREITAKRRIVDRCEQAIASQGIAMEDGQEDLALEVLEMLAATWMEHPEHRMTWPR